MKNTKTITVIDILSWMLFIYALISYYLTSQYIASEQLLKLFVCAFVYVGVRMSMAIIPRTWIKYVSLLIPLAGGYEAIVGILQGLEIISSNNQNFMITGTFLNPGPYSIAIVGALCYCIACFERKEQTKWVKYLCIACCILCALVLPATQSRTAFVALGACCLIIYRKRLKLRNILIIALIAVAAGTMLYYFKKESADGRVFIWLISLKAVFSSKWLSGYGLGGFRPTYATFAEEYFSNHPDTHFLSVASCPEYSFNDYIQIGVELGIIGIILAVSLAVTAIKALIKNNTAIGYSALAVLICSLFSYPFNLLQFQVFATFCLAIGAVYCQKEQKHGIATNAILSIVAVISILLSVKSNNSRSSLLDDHYYFSMGQHLNSEHLYNESNQYLLKGLMMSDDPMFYNVMGRNYQSLGAYKLAEESYFKAFGILPNRIYPLKLLMDLYKETKETDKLINIATKIINFKPKIVSDYTDEVQKEAQQILDTNIHTYE